MTFREPRFPVMAVGLIIFGLALGAFLSQLSFPHISRAFNTCASSKQFLVEFRRVGAERWSTYGDGGPYLLLSSPVMDVDGVSLGTISDGGSIRRFLCEGNHTAHISYPGPNGDVETHTLEFAVSRASLFEVTQTEKQPDGDCNSARPCTSKVWFQLSAYEPDDPKVRFPEDRR